MEKDTHLRKSLASSIKTRFSEAPKALLIPISFVLVWAMKVDKPKRPRQAIITAMMER